MSQERVFEFVEHAHAPGAAPPQRIDTHAASVFLFSDRVLKIKRAVRLQFLDYSTLEKRKAACEAELAVNRPFAPQIYRGVVPITREPEGTLAIGGAGTPVEWAVEMARFDERCTLDHLAEKGIDSALTDALGRAVAQAHAQAPVVPPEPWIEAIGVYVEEHETAFRAAPELFPASEIDDLTRHMRDTYKRIRPLLVRRGERGLVRRCHGDLHLGNIVLIDRQPVLFDAIEFSDLVASGDILYDLAFLLMDLHARGLDAAANMVFNRYLIEMHRDADLDGLAALPYYLAMRAAIRAKVAAARHQRGVEADAKAIAAEAYRYFKLARELITPPPAQMIAVGGLSGTGKSLLARSLAPQIAPIPGAVLLRSDVERKRMFATPETERLPREAYTPEISAKLYKLLTERAVQVIAAGHSAIVDAVFAKAEERQSLAAAAECAGVTLHGLFLKTSLELRRRRVGTRVADASDADAAVVAEQEGYETGAIDWTEIDASGSPDETLGSAQAVLQGGDG